ncbi:hypothetical protein OROMI_017258 [Orobanche minor]
MLRALGVVRPGCCRRSGAVAGGCCGRLVFVRPGCCGRSGAAAGRSRAELLGAAAGRVGVLRGRFQVRADLDELVRSWSIASGAGRSRPPPSPCRAVAAGF